MDILTIIGVIVSFLIANIALVAGIVKKLSSVSKEVGELFVAIAVATQDGKVTGDELRNIIKEAKDVFDAVKKIRDKTIAAPN